MLGIGRKIKKDLVTYILKYVKRNFSKRIYLFFYNHLNFLSHRAEHLISVVFEFRLKSNFFVYHLKYCN